VLVGIVIFGPGIVVFSYLSFPALFIFSIRKARYCLHCSGHEHKSMSYTDMIAFWFKQGKVVNVRKESISKHKLIASLTANVDPFGKADPS